MYFNEQKQTNKFKQLPYKKNQVKGQKKILIILIQKMKFFSGKNKKTDNKLTKNKNQKDLNVPRVLLVHFESKYFWYGWIQNKKLAVIKSMQALKIVAFLENKMDHCFHRLLWQDSSKDIYRLIIPKKDSTLNMFLLYIFIEENRSLSNKDSFVDQTRARNQRITFGPLSQNQKILRSDLFELSLPKITVWMDIYIAKCENLLSYQSEVKN